MNLTLPTTPAERFAATIEGLCGAVAARSAMERLLSPLLCLVWSRLRRIGARVSRLAARIPANAPPRPHSVHPCRAAVPPAPPAIGVRQPAAPHRWAHLPRRPGWLLRFIPPAVFPASSRLRHLLADPATAALLAASPGLRRTILPLCRMLGVPAPAACPARRPRRHPGQHPADRHAPCAAQRFSSAPGPIGTPPDIAAPHLLASGETVRRVDRAGRNAQDIPHDPADRQLR